MAKESKQLIGALLMPTRGSSLPTGRLVKLTDDLESFRGLIDCKTIEHLSTGWAPGVVLDAFMDEEGMLARKPYVYLDLAHASQSHVIFLAAMESPEANPGPESFEARLFSEDEIPWDKIAFNSVDKILRLYFDDAKTGNFPFHYIERHKQGKIP